MFVGSYSFFSFFPGHGLPLLVASFCHSTLLPITHVLLFFLLQVLLATGGGHLVYLEIGDGVLNEVKYAKLDYDISCLDINPIGENPNYSHIAAVGMWTDISVRIYSLPDLNLITKEQLGGEIIPRSVLMCSFEGVCSPSL